MWTEPVLEAEPARRKLVAAPAVVTVDEAHHLARTVPVVVLRATEASSASAQRNLRVVGKKETHRRPEGAGRDVPAPGEDEEVGERCAGRLGARGQNAEDGGVDVVTLDAADVHKLLHSVLVWDVAAGRRVVRIDYEVKQRSGHENSLSVPCDNVKWRVLLLADKELTANLVHDCQRDQVCKISGTRKSIPDAPSQGDWSISKLATGLSKSLGFARPCVPSGPRSGRSKWEPKISRMSGANQLDMCGLSRIYSHPRDGPSGSAT